MARKSNAMVGRIVIGAVIVLLGAGYWLYHRQAAHKLDAETAAAWMITGPACPVPAAGVAGPALTHRTDLDGVAALVREVGGAAVCSAIKENGDGAPLTICQFIAPGALKVVTKKGTYDFAPAHGVDASIVIRDDVPSCVLHVNPALFK